jgi:hypothetical protein
LIKPVMVALLKSQHSQSWGLQASLDCKVRTYLKKTTKKTTKKMWLIFCILLESHSYLITSWLAVSDLSSWSSFS